jgi:hypothetical protein
MSASEVIAEIKSLGAQDREQVLRFLVSNKSLREDLQDSLCSKLVVMNRAGLWKMCCAI